MEALFRAYCAKGCDIGNRQTLIDVVADACSERQLTEAILYSDEGIDAIQEAEGLFRRHRMDGVPFFIIDNEIRLAGGQPPDAHLAAFTQALGSK